MDQERPAVMGRPRSILDILVAVDDEPRPGLTSGSARTFECFGHRTFGKIRLRPNTVQAPDCLIHVHISSLVRSMLLNQPDESVMRWFTLIVALLLDPAAAPCSWQRRRHGRKRQSVKAARVPL